MEISRDLYMLGMSIIVLCPSALRCVENYYRWAYLTVEELVWPLERSAFSLRLRVDSGFLAIVCR